MSTPQDDSNINSYSFKVLTKDNKLFEILFSLKQETLSIEAKFEKDYIKTIYVLNQSYNDLVNTDKIFNYFENINNSYENIVEIIKNEANKILIIEDKDNNSLIIKIPISLGQKKEIVFKLTEKNISNEEKIKSLKDQVIMLTKQLEELNSPHYIEEGDYIIYSALDENACLEYTNNGHKIILNKYELNKKTQIFKIKIYDQISHCIYNDLNEILDTKIENNTEIYFCSEKHYRSNQIWVIIKFGKYYYISPRSKLEKCIDITDIFGIGGRAILYDKHLARNQLFKFKKISN